MKKAKIVAVLLVVVFLVMMAPAVSAKTQVYNVKPGDTLWLISRDFNLPIDKLMDINGLKNYKIYVGQRLYVTTRVVTYPQNDQDNYNQGENDHGNWFVYTIKRGDTLWGLSSKYGVSLSKLIEVNNISNSNDLYIGRRIIIPTAGGTTRPQTPAPQGYYLIYEVEEGDRIWNIAYRLGTTVYEIMRLNNLQDMNNIQAGTQLLVKIDEEDVSGISNYARKINRVYTVRAGDTIQKIGEFFGVEPKFIAKINGLTTRNLYPGQRLLMPVSDKLFGQHDYYLVRQDKEYLFDVAYYYGVSVKAMVKANYYSDLNTAVSKGTILIVPLDQGSRVNWKTYDGNEDNSWF